MMTLRSWTRAMTLLLLMACGSKGEPEGFIEASSFCRAQALQTQYVIRWKTGETSLVTASDKKSFLSTFFEENKESIQWAEHNFAIQLPQPIEDRVSTLSLPQPDWGPSRVKAPELWSRGIFGENILVAVVDTGVDVHHEQLAGNIFVNPDEEIDGADSDGNGWVDDRNGYNFVEKSGDVFDDKGHGTHVAGIIAARHDKGVSLGVAPQAQILPLRAMDAGGFGSSLGAAQSIEYAAQMGAHIINASWGGAGCSQVLYEAIEALQEKDILFVAASGNAGMSLDTFPVYPARFDFSHQITVGSSGTADHMSHFSNYSRKSVHLLAPGFLIWGLLPGDREAPDSGTSMAAPIVAGAAALLKSAFPQTPMTQIRKALLEGVDGPPQRTQNQVEYPVWTDGRLNIYKSFELLQKEI